MNQDLSLRKIDHLDLAQVAQTVQKDHRFLYEPFLAAHPESCDRSYLQRSFLGKTMKWPLWISSMTGGALHARHINQNLAKAASKFGLGMGLGSCRPLLEGDEQSFADFNLRPLLGTSPFWANLGIAQIEMSLESQLKRDKINEMVKRLQADGLIIHVNPLQEWLQPEGDRLKRAPIETIKRFLDQAHFPVMVKEVGQGQGPQGLKELLKLPLAAIDFASFGGTNFALLEILRTQDEVFKEQSRPLCYVGHDADDMVNFINEALDELGPLVECREFIISGGIKSFLDGFYYMRKLKASSVYGQASPLLNHARKSFEELECFLENEFKHLSFAHSYLNIKES